MFLKLFVLKPPPISHRQMYFRQESVSDALLAFTVYLLFYNKTEGDALFSISSPPSHTGDWVCILHLDFPDKYF